MSAQEILNGDPDPEAADIMAVLTDAHCLAP
jgi:hypothetical protein